MASREKISRQRQLPLGDPLHGRWVRIASIWAGFWAASLVTGIFLAQLFAALGGLLALVIYLRRETGRPYWHPAAWGLAAVAAVFILAALFSHRPLHSLERIIRNFALPVVAFFATLLLMRSTSVRKVAFNTIIIAGILSGFYALFQHLTGTDPLYGQEIVPMNESGAFQLYIPKGLLNNTLTYCGVQVLIFFFILPTVWKARGKGAWKLWVALALLFFSVFITYKRGPLLALVVVSGLFLLTRGKKVAIATILAGVVLFGGLYAGYPTFRERIDEAVQMKTESETTRLYLWDAAWKMGLESPLLGVGPGCWHDFVNDYIPEDVYLVSRAHPHSDPLYVWATSGILGVVAMTALIGLLLWKGRQELWRWTIPDPRRSLYSGGMLALLAFFVLSLTQCYLIDGEDLLALSFVLGTALAGREFWLRSEKVQITGDRKDARR